MTDAERIQQVLVSVCRSFTVSQGDDSNALDAIQDLTILLNKAEGRNAHSHDDTVQYRYGATLRSA